MSLGTIILIVLILMLIGVFPSWPHSSSWGYGPSGGIGSSGVATGASALAAIGGWVCCEAIADENRGPRRSIA